MLVLTRKVHEALVFGDGDIRIVVLSVQGDQVKLGIDAPRDVAVLREEILQAQAQNEAAAFIVSPADLTKLAEDSTSPPSPDLSPKSR